MRFCTKCGNHITDSEKHLKAMKCPECRKKAQANGQRKASLILILKICGKKA